VANGSLGEFASTSSAWFVLRACVRACGHAGSACLLKGGAERAWVYRFMPRTPSRGSRMNRACSGALRILLILLWGCPWALAGATDCAPVSVILRHDDYTARSPIEIEKELFAGIERLGASVVVGVVPFFGAAVPPEGSTANLSRDKIALLADYAARDIVELAVHGYRHVDSAIPDSNSEFAGVPAGTQAKWAREAKRAVEAAFGKPARIFIPPWNRHDANTVAAVEAAGYRVLSSSQAQPAAGDAGLLYLPGTLYPQDFAATIDQLLADGQCGGILVVTSHPYDFARDRRLPEFRTGKTIPLRRFLEQLRQRRDTGAIEVVGVGGLLQRHEDLGSTRFSLNQRLRDGGLASRSLLPYRLGLYPPPGIYYEAEDARRWLWHQHAVIVVIYWGTLGVTTAFTLLLARQARKRGRLGLCGVAFALAVVVFTVYRAQGDGGVSFALLCTLAAGMMLGLFLAMAGDHRRAADAVNRSELVDQAEGEAAH